MTTDRQDDDFSLTPEQISSIAIVIQRAAVMLSRSFHDQPTGSEVADTIGEAAHETAYQIQDMMKRMVGPDREEFAKEKGWPSADALQQFIMNRHDESAPPSAG